MPVRPGPLVPSFERWKAVERRANAAEVALLRAQIAYCRGEAALPAPELTREVRELRQQASALLASALREMQQASRGLRWPPADQTAGEQSGPG